MTATFQYDGQPRKKKSSVFALSWLNPYAEASTSTATQPGCGSICAAIRKQAGRST